MKNNVGIKNFRYLAAALAATMLMASCVSVEKFLQPDERVLNKNQYEIVTADGDKPSKEIDDALSDMRKYVKQTPNTHLLGIGPRFSMRVYCLSNPDKDNFWHKYLRRKGSAPVVYSEAAAIHTCQQLTGLLESKGCFHSSVSFDTIHVRKHDLNVVYKINAARRYLIDNVTFRAESAEVDKLLREWKDESLLKAGDYYDQDKMDEERTRVADRLRNEGYYYASADLISYLVDTAFEDHKLTIRMNIRNPRIVDANRQTRTMPLQKYRIDEIFIYPNTSASNSGLTSSYDTITVPMHFRNFTTNYHYLFNQPMTLKPNVINRALFLFHNQLFRPRNINRTYSSLLSLRNFKYINTEFVESPNSTDTNRLLNAKVRLLTAKRQRLTASLELNNSSPFGSSDNGLMSGNFGLETKLAYQNKNLFGGAELFNAEGSLLVELPKLIFKNRDNDDIRNNVSNFESGINLSLDLPTFLFPFTKDILWQRARPHTVINAGANYQLHSYFERLLGNIGFGYNWSHNQHGHQLLPLELTYVNFFNIDSTFRSRMQSISDARVKYQYSDHFIMDARYDYVYNTQQYGTRTNFNYLHLSVESAGNLLSGIYSLTGGEKDENGIREIFGVPFSQYVRLNAEYKHYFYFGQKSTFITRLMAGVGIPYGNSKAMPYEKSFFGGGPTTIRAWHLRYLGPGNFQSSENDMLERIGDIQLVANLEYRFPIVSIFEGALFADLGNVWLANESQEFPDGQLKLDNLLQSIATGIGFGLRANISIITLRCDLAIPLYDPGAAENRRWRPPYWKFSQITANFGIDYPF
ncbi:MAG: BamA/TamA family outer membrane protein [Bacteroidales bacterium]|nr:BamA/TamA family outer membrane protein [Bacteroidales bacterium]